jgi:hypothetical protein
MIVFIARLSPVINPSPSEGAEGGSFSVPIIAEFPFSFNTQQFRYRAVSSERDAEMGITGGSIRHQLKDLTEAMILHLSA